MTATRLCLFRLAKAKEPSYGLIATEGILTIIGCIDRKFLQKECALKVLVKYFNEKLGKALPLLQDMGAAQGYG